MAPDHYNAHMTSLTKKFLKEFDHIFYLKNNPSLEAFFTLSPLTLKLDLYLNPTKTYNFLFYLFIFLGTF